MRTVLLPVRATVGVAKVSAKTGYRTGRLSARSTYLLGRLVGLRRALVLGAGKALKSLGADLSTATSFTSCEPISLLPLIGSASTPSDPMAG